MQLAYLIVALLAANPFAVLRQSVVAAVNLNVRLAGVVARTTALGHECAASVLQEKNMLRIDLVGSTEVLRGENFDRFAGQAELSE